MEGDGWDATKEQKDKFIPMIKEFMEKAKENPNTLEYVDLYNKGISPAQLENMLRDDLGFEEIAFDRNGWEMEFWITMRKDGIDYMIAGAGITFEMVFRLA